MTTQCQNKPATLDTPNKIKALYNKYSIAVWAYICFTIIGIVVWIIRDIRYFFLFNGIGSSELITRIIVIRYPQHRQLMRRIIQIFIGSLLLFMLGLGFGVDFQFEHIFFDLQAGIVTGALIHGIIARLVIPFVFGNACCSRACWDGMFFEAMNSKTRCKTPTKRNPWIAWGYMALLILMTIFVARYFTNPSGDEHELLRKKWIIAQNIFIVTLGFILTFVWGSRAYCRMLCPYMTISSLLYRFSFFKITPIKSADCTQCGACSNACPMLIDVKESVRKKEKIQDPQCILCERCVSACKRNVLRISHKKAE
ncbi:MAG: 4Fe-4S binding protein [Salinivirgaceae bacterium]|nr:4Fe-4S binding protein [Salinivirgaceae bacterium]